MRAVAKIAAGVLLLTSSAHAAMQTPDDQKAVLDLFLGFPSEAQLVW